MRHWVYILSNKKGLTYTGIAHNLRERLREHLWRRSQFTAKYRITKLVFVEPHPDKESAAKREKQIKGWRRSRKHALIESVNPGWSDLSEPFR
ncbi:MAG: GIY-YIG nuclease family protein [Gemmatimonadaceae bacterium]